MFIMLTLIQMTRSSSFSNLDSELPPDFPDISVASCVATNAETYSLPTEFCLFLT